MIEMTQPTRKSINYPFARNDKLDRIQNHFISEANVFFLLFSVTVIFAIALLFVGIILLFVGIISVGTISAIASPVVGLISKLLYNKNTEANRRVDEMRIGWEEQVREEQKKLELEQEERRKKLELEQEEDRRILEYMKFLRMYYDLASKTDDEQEKEEYFHYIFPSEEYNKKKIETYLRILQLEDEAIKIAFFREKLGLLLKSAEAVPIT
jgi:hypothetical protein